MSSFTNFLTALDAWRMDNVGAPVSVRMSLEDYGNISREVSPDMIKPGMRLLQLHGIDVVIEPNMSAGEFAFRSKVKETLPNDNSYPSKEAPDVQNHA